MVRVDVLVGMAVIAEFRLTDGDLPILDALKDGPGVTVTLEKLVPFGSEIAPYLWVEGQYGGFERTLQADPRVESVTLEGTAGDQALFHTKWGSEVHETVRRLGVTDPTILGATGDETGWRFQLRFSNHDDVGRYVKGSEEAGLAVEIRRLVTLDYAYGSTRAFGLSTKQREAVELAAERGYFETPRQVTMTELAEELDITQQALSSRLRRGVNKIVSAGLDYGDEFDVG